MGLFRETKHCHICKKKIKSGVDLEFPPVCPCCGADLKNPAAEVLADSIECSHVKGTFGIGTGMLYATNKRLIFVKGDEDWILSELNEDTPLKGSNNPLVSMIANWGGRKAIIDIPLDNVGRLEDCKRLLSKGVTLHTKSGEAYNLYHPSMNPKELKDFLAPYVAK